jgi:hypothetical protein
MDSFLIIAQKYIFFHCASLTNLSIWDCFSIQHLMKFNQKYPAKFYALRKLLTVLIIIDISSQKN